MERKLKRTCSSAPVKFKIHKRKTITDGTDHESYDGDDVKLMVSNRAREIQANLSTKFPSLIKYMLPSHVERGFIVGLPVDFCEFYMPKKDTMMTLVYENNKYYEVKYLAEKKCLSGGWRGFAVAHNLVEGEAVVFQLIEPTTIQVYIVRANGQDEADSALGSLELVNCSKSSISARSVSITMEDIGIANLDNCNDNLKLVSAQTDDKNGDLGFKACDGIRVPDSAVDFKNVKAFEDFKIIINGISLTSELTKDILSNYYELCCSQKSYLHQNLRKGLNDKFVSGLIIETTNIADAIRATKPTISQDYTTWKDTLQLFEKFGMNVGFLIARLDKLMTISAKFDRYLEANREKSSCVVDKNILETKLKKIKERIKTLDSEIETLDSCERVFDEIAKAPW